MSINQLTHDWAQKNNLKSYFYPEITSTNDIAKLEFAKSKNDFAIYLADNQTRGRGRNQNTWSNMSNGEVLLSTWCFRSNASPQPTLTPLLGLALYESLYIFDSALPLRLKAPNDIYLGKGKLSGLLVEAVQQGGETLIFVGLGLNALGAPETDVKTSSLNDFSETVKDQWPKFCMYLYNQFQLAIEKGEKPTLTSDDCDDFLEALNFGIPEDEQIQKVSPNCDLHTKNGVVSWMNL